LIILFFIHFYIQQQQKKNNNNIRISVDHPDQLADNNLHENDDRLIVDEIVFFFLTKDEVQMQVFFVQYEISTRLNEIKIHVKDMMEQRSIYETLIDEDYHVILRQNHRH
jgi:hypothetical protein